MRPEIVLDRRRRRLGLLQDAEQLQTMIWERPGLRRELPCYLYEGRRIWGLTFRMIAELLQYLG